MGVSDAVPGIEVGATDDDLRYWKAKEAVRQGEARLAAQANVRATLEARATALTGWAAISLLAATGAAFTAKEAATASGAGVTVVVLFGAAVLGIHAARPRNWTMVGYDPVVISSDTLGSELEILESVAAGISHGIQENNVRLDGMAKSLRVAGWLLIAAPLFGAAAYESQAVIRSFEAVVRRFL